MQPFSWINRVWVLATALELMGASCTTQVTTDNRPLTSNPRPLTLMEPDVATKVKVQAAYGKLPLSFEANQGQSNPQVKFLSRGKGYTLFLTPTEAVLTLRKSAPAGHWDAETWRHGDTGTIATSQLPPTPDPSPLTVLRMKLLGANPRPQVTGLEALPGKVNYFIGNDPKKWHTNVSTYAKVKYEGVYPGVDLIYYGNQRQLEYDFIVAPGADPQAIKFAFKGADKVETDAQGDLVLHTAGGETRLHKPRIYQEINGVKQPIPGGYVLLELETRDSELKTHKVGFQVAAYDASRPLVIDPVLSYSTYLGGDNTDVGTGIAVDAEGNAYVTGSTFSADFPTANAFQPIPGGNSDAFITKLSASGSAVMYSTYLGSSRDDYSTGIAVDATGNVYITGWGTCSVSESCDTFVTKLSASGSALVYSIYLSSSHWSSAIAVDAEGNAYVTGSVTGSSSPRDPDDYLDDIYVAKLSASGQAFVYFIYLGGSGFDWPHDIAVDAAGNAYVTGRTESSHDFPTANPFQAAYAGGALDAFMTKLSNSGAIIYSTYLGGSGLDYGRDIAIDAEGNAYVTGWTESTDFPTASAFQPAHGGRADAFVTKFDSSGSAVIYSTYLGGIGDDEGFSIAVDASGNAYVTGDTSSRDFPTMTPLQPRLGYHDAFVAKLFASGSKLVYSTYLGGSDGETGFSITVDSEGNAYVTGETYSLDFPTTQGAFQSTFGGYYSDSFVTKIADDTDCPVDTALEEDPNRQTKIDFLRQFRDQVLGTSPEGQYYVQLFYAHAVEVSWLLLRYPELRSQSRALIDRLLPVVQNLLAGEQAVVRQAELKEAEALLDTLAAYGSAELQADIQAVQTELREGEVLEQFGIVVR